MGDGASTLECQRDNLPGPCLEPPAAARWGHAASCDEASRMSACSVCASVLAGTCPAHLPMMFEPNAIRMMHMHALARHAVARPPPAAKPSLQPGPADTASDVSPSPQGMSTHAKGMGSTSSHTLASTAQSPSVPCASATNGTENEGIESCAVTLDFLVNFAKGLPQDWTTAQVRTLLGAGAGVSIS